MATLAPRKRTRKGGSQQYRDFDPGDPDAQRRRKASANKVLTILKAALNQAWHDGRAESDDAWRNVRPFPGVDEPKVRYLSSEECTRLINASDQDFRKLVQAALLTGARYGELTAMLVGDYLSDTSAIHIRESKNGRPRHIPLNDQGAAFFEQLAAGRPISDRLFLRGDGDPWGPSHQRRRLIEAARRARIENVTFHILRHCYASALAMQGVPLTVVAAALGHLDTRTTEKHYGHLSPSFVADTIRANLPVLGSGALVEPVTPIRGRQP